MNRMTIFNLVYEIKKRKTCGKRCGGSSVNGICFNEIVLIFFLAANLRIHYKGLTLFTVCRRASFTCVFVAQAFHEVAYLFCPFYPFIIHFVNNLKPNHFLSFGLMDNKVKDLLIITINTTCVCFSTCCLDKWQSFTF